jgi:hypothetical protein
MTAVLPPDQEQPPPAPEPSPTSAAQRYWATTAALLAVVAIGISAVVLATVLLGDAPEPGPPAAPTATTTASPAPSPAPTSEPEPTPTTSPSAPPTTTPTSTPPVVPPDATTAVWPTAGSGIRYIDPVAAARGFAVTLVGFADPVLGEYRSGDSRSGEVEVRPAEQGPATTVFVRKLGDDTWWVLGAATAGIQLDSPAAGDLLAPPAVTLSGRALAFEGTVAVRILDDRTDRPLATGVVTGGGDQLRPFEGTVELAQPGTDHGALVLTTENARDGSVWSACVIRVAFAR